MATIDRETLLKIYRNMVRLRCFDDKVNLLVESGIRITQHSTRGQEATTIAACTALQPNDYVMPYHRGWGWAIGKGMDPKVLLAELMGKRTGCCVGKGGVHIADCSLRIMGRPGIQAAHVPIGAGVGLSIKFRKTNEVVMVFFGDGASNEGNIHEGMNLASVWKAPVVFFVREQSVRPIYSQHRNHFRAEYRRPGTGLRNSRELWWTVTMPLESMRWRGRPFSGLVQARDPRSSRRKPTGCTVIRRWIVFIWGPIGKRTKWRSGRRRTR